MPTSAVTAAITIGGDSIVCGNSSSGGSGIFCDCIFIRENTGLSDGFHNWFMPTSAVTAAISGDNIVCGIKMLRENHHFD